MKHTDQTPQDPIRDPLRFPVNTARRMETPRQHMRWLQADSNRTIEALAARLDCLGWFDSFNSGPRAA